MGEKVDDVGVLLGYLAVSDHWSKSDAIYSTEEVLRLGKSIGGCESALELSGDDDRVEAKTGLSSTSVDRCGEANQRGDCFYD
jgi:hypothetical protein